MAAKKKVSPKPKPKAKSVPKSAPKKAVVRPVVTKKPVRKPRRPVAWDRWLWAATVLNLTAGLLYSPVTALRSVRVMGADANDQVVIEQALQGARHTPFAQLTDASVIGPLYNLERVQSATMTRNIFGRGVVTLTTPTVLARVAGFENLAMTENGEMRIGLAIPENAPEVFMPEAELTAMPSLVSLTPASIVADLVKETTKRWPDQDWTVHVDEGGVLSLRKDSGPVVILGVANKIDAKVSALAEILLSQPTLADKAVRITLTEPSAPAIAPLVLERS